MAYVDSGPKNCMIRYISCSMLPPKVDRTRPDVELHMQVTTHAGKNCMIRYISCSMLPPKVDRTRPDVELHMQVQL